MMPEIGNGLLCLALGIALLLSVYPLWGVARGDARMMASSRLFAWLLFMSVAGAFLVLVNAFMRAPGSRHAIPHRKLGIGVAGNIG
ncbi:hypothetical protein ACUOA5_42280, partial [Escherichia coli]